MKLSTPFQFLLIASLVMAAAGSLPRAATAKAQPQLIETAAADPSQIVRIIAQKTSDSKVAEQRVAHLGGEVLRDLHIIDAFTAQMTAEAAIKLAQSDSVRWVSLDAPVQQAGLPNKFSTWSTAVGKIVKNAFTNPNNMLSAAGPNNTYGYGANIKGSFTGFQPEYNPGQKISKVEVALKLYLSATVTGAEAPKITAYAKNKAGLITTVSPTGINACVGASKACLSYVDITASRAWLWDDFATLEIVIDQSTLAKTKKIYYDAVGIRITTADGSDGTTPLAMATSSTTTINTAVMQNIFPSVVRATDVWSSYKGSGITVAVIDSGNFRTNALGNRLLGVLNFNSAEHLSADQYGHGTHVTGIIADASNSYPGVAPAANILGLRVADDYGMAYESDVIAAMQWVYLNKIAYNIRVVNLSLNSSVYQSYDSSPLNAAAEILWFNSIVVVVSAGNNGTSTLYPPANDPFVITVGATDDKNTIDFNDDIVSTFSAYGQDDLGRTKPDLVAPGRNIIAYLPDTNQLTIPVQHPEGVVSSNYFRMSGTSMAAPIVSGAAALLLQSNPNLTPDQVKYRLMATANKSWPGYSQLTSGAGYLDIYSAVTGMTTESANNGLEASNLLSSGSEPITWGSVGWNSVGWNSVGWNSVGWNSVGWNSVGWNSDYWGR
jgi:serine protease AprX